MADSQIPTKSLTERKVVASLRGEPWQTGQ